jgi:hypothetical protein
MKKVFLILLTSVAMAACGDGSNRSEANREESENYDNTTPSVTPDDRMQTDTTSIYDTDTTGVRGSGTTGGGTTR